MGRTIAFVYGVIAYVVFFATFLYLIGFVTNVAVPKSIDGGVEGSVGTAVLINLLLVGLFAVQHSVMARPGFKAWFTRMVPEPIERSTFVLAGSLLLVLLFALWRPMGGIIWQFDHLVPRAALTGLGFAGWLLALYSTFLIDHFDLFGLRQVYFHLRDREYSHPQFMERSVYKIIRHPLMAGFLIGIWATPTMTQGHLLFAVAMSVYTFIGIALEERDLERSLGDDYRRYRERTSMILPLPKRKTVERPQPIRSP